ncbi:DNA polymerase III subunit alpha [Solitalea lacus]|uniref:DNA polymerase III subunit alpha n=1 Tax=Solitalea lacus TaxID=2911172 RepID=UPI001EDB8592|nr:DNA polymerase III subunit alpha [Solitalea lacus]UKJ08825.1 DNA polymerase III subunit alpha [Solitalea lacus]
MPEFSHLHVHTQFSLLDGAADISKLFKKAANDGMRALAITDHGNMFGVFKFVAEAGKHDNKVKPIVGCEFYVVADRHEKKFSKEKKDKRYHQLFLAKNANGYKNLTKLCSYGYMEGLYSKWPRIDKELILKYHEDLIATTCCIGASVPQAILNEGEEAAEKEFKWWLDIFGEDYYIELQRHNLPEQVKVNEVLLRFAKKYNVKVIASNDSHYVDQADANAHDILLCINTGDIQSTPIATDEEGGKGYRFGFPNDQFFFKTQAEMNALFHDIPEAIDNTNEIVDKVDLLKLKQDILLPNFPIPPGFVDQMQYLEHITWEGARARYGDDLTPDKEERINFELHTIRTMGFAGYFLIVSDFIKAGRDMGVFIGPGRGSAAGSAVAYCIGITNIDPIKYNLLFERFLNPDRKSMPDIDTDFDDEGRQRVIDYVVDKYGKTQVAQIITYGSMAAKMSIKDVARALDLPLPDSNAMAKLVPDKPGISLDRVMNAPIDGDKSLKDKEGLGPEDIENVKQLREIREGSDLRSKVIKEALILEGSIRGTGIHAAGIIIAPEDLTNIVPVAVAKDSDLLVTQYEGKVIEDAGVIKMDFLGLKTLTIIRDALRMIKENHGVEFDIDYIPLDDQKTFELYQRGETNGTFQFESPGMQKYLKDLVPDKFEDLIAMNALYRPGPIEYIPDFIERKHGRKAVEYDLADMEEYLFDTYGITVYQEQVMLLSQKLANFTKGDADVLRKAMGKKDRKTLDKLKPQFIDNAKEKGHDAKVLEKVWTDWEAFASYAFNKSHSTCYAFVAYQTAYLKAHYPAEYMASVLTHTKGQIDKITFFMEECKRIGVPVLGPDVNESALHFTATKKGQIRFGLSGIKGLGEAAIESLVTERKENGPYESVYDFARRVNLRAVNKKSWENLVYSGAFDCYGEYHRAQYFGVNISDRLNGIERLVKYGNDFVANQNSAQNSLFGGTADAHVPEPPLPDSEEWSLLQKLSFEKEVVGMYISGHPLDDYKLEIENFCNSQIIDLATPKPGTLVVAGIITSAEERLTKHGKPFGGFTFEDYSGSHRMIMFSEDYLKNKHFFQSGLLVFVRGSFKPRFGQADNLEFKVESIQLLSEIREKMAKNVTLSFPLHELTLEFIDNLEALCKANPGNCKLKLNVIDALERIVLDLPSKSIKVDPNNNFMSEIGKFKNVNFSLN